jgi:hypothetical protein
MNNPPIDLDVLSCLEEDFENFQSILQSIRVHESMESNANSIKNVLWNLTVGGLCGVYQFNVNQGTFVPVHLSEKTLITEKHWFRISSAGKEYLDKNWKEEWVVC